MAAVLIRLPGPVLIRLFSLLLLAVIALQASEPVRGIGRDHGSAFSAATYEVAIANSRHVETASVSVAPTPLPKSETGAFPDEPAIRISLPSPRPDSTGPPAGAILARQPAPRGPPLT